MKFGRFSVVSAVAFFSMSTLALAQNRDDEDAIFNGSQEGGWTQILLGLVEVVTASSIYPKASAEVKRMKGAEFELEMTKNAPESEAQRKELIKELKRKDVLTGKEERKLNWLRTRKLLNPDEQKTALKAAQMELTQARAAALEAAKAEGALAKTIKGVRVAGSTLLILDVLGRVYVWNALDADPTFSPGVTLILESID